MSRATYNVQETKTGTGSKLDYTFGFKIEEKSQLLAVKRDASGVEIARVRGTDTSTLIDSVTFDSEEGGGTVNLLTNLEASYTLDLFLANDAPTQPTVLRNKFDFTLRNIENALDWVLGPVQRAIFLASRSVKLLDVLDLATFDVNLPSNIVGSDNRVLGTNSDGDAFEMGPTFDEVANAQTYANNAAAAETAAEVAQAAAEAAQDLAETARDVAIAASATASASAPPAVVTAITDSMSAATITDGVNPYTFTPGTGTGETEWVSVEYSVYRGTTVVGRGEIQLVYDGSAWQIFEGGFNYPDGKSADHGLTFSMSGNSLQVAADGVSGAGKLYTRAFQA